MEYTITLTEAENKVLRHITYDPQQWIETVVKERCRVAIEEIVTKEIQRIISEGGTITGTKEDIILAMDLKTGKEIQDAMVQEMRTIDYSTPEE